MKVEALLITRCGCRRTLPITYPPPHYIQVPLDMDRRTYDLNQPFPNPDSGPPTFDTISRRFDLDSAPYQVGDKVLVTYVEKP